jgi:3-hydroxyacyl-[acyl-carrier-protein] dehydratase
MPETVNGIFKIDLLSHSAGQIEAIILVDPDHPILKGHFPGQPVVPGACMLQLVKDIIAAVLEANIIMEKATAIKFISMITPETSLKANISLGYKIEDDGKINVSAVIKTEELTCFKLQAVYVKL